MQSRELERVLVVLKKAQRGRKRPETDTDKEEDMLAVLSISMLCAVKGFCFSWSS